jgi:hypothetical protein
MDLLEAARGLPQFHHPKIGFVELVSNFCQLMFMARRGNEARITFPKQPTKIVVPT